MTQNNQVMTYEIKADSDWLHLPINVQSISLLANKKTYINEKINLTNIIKANEVNVNYNYNLLKIVEYVDLTNIKNLTLNINLTTNMDFLFKCTNLIFLDMSKCCGTLDSAKLSNCTKIKKLFLPAKINKMALDTLCDIEYIKFGENYNDDPVGLFDKCLHLKQVDFSDGFNQKIGSSFKSNLELQIVFLGKSFNQYISDEFKQCLFLTDIYLASRCSTAKLQKNNPNVKINNI